MFEDCDRTVITQACFDGELSGDEATAADLHRRFCASCRATWETLELSRSFAATATRHLAPDRLRRTILRRTYAMAAAAGVEQPIPTPGPVPPRRRWLPPLAGFGTGIALAASVMLWVITCRSDVLVAEVVAGHIRSLQPGHAVDVRRQDRRDDPSNWFVGRIAFAPPIKDLATQGFPLEGCRLDYLANQPVAAMVYDRSGHRINLFAWPAGTPSDETPVAATRDGFHILHWAESGFTLWAVSDVGASELDDFARSWRADG